MPTRREFLALTGSLVCAQCSRTARRYDDANADGPPNILLILTDDQGWSQLSIPMDPAIPESGSAYLESPNMTRLAREGVRFSNGYAPAPICTPTRRSILCGMTPARQRGTEFISEFVPTGHLTIPKALKQADSRYRCAHFGKWGGETMAAPPESCGYDVSDGVTGNFTGGMPRIPNPADRPEFYVKDDPKLTRSVSSRAVNFMREQVAANRPFYVQVSYYAVHEAIEVRKETLKKYEKKGVPDRGYSEAWAAMFEDLDTGIGLLLQALDDMNIARNTYVFLTSDNGGATVGQNANRWPSNYPLRGTKGTLYEGGIRVPFIVRGAGIASGSCCRVPVAGYDLLPTFYELAGGEDPLPGNIDGGSLIPLLTNPANGNVRRPLGALVFHRPGLNVSVIRRNNEKLLAYLTPEGGIQKRELFDLQSDPFEKNDVARSQSARADALQKLLLDYLTAVSAETPADIVRQRAARRRNREE